MNIKTIYFQLFRCYLDYHAVSTAYLHWGDVAVLIRRVGRRAAGDAAAPACHGVRLYLDGVECPTLTAVARLLRRSLPNHWRELLQLSLDSAGSPRLNLRRVQQLLDQNQDTLAQLQEVCQKHGMLATINYRNLSYFYCELLGRELSVDDRRVLAGVLQLQIQRTQHRLEWPMDIKHVVQ
jgi:hypothetical protein